MAIESGFAKFKRRLKLPSGDYKTVSHWTSSETVEMPTTGKTLEETLGANLINVHRTLTKAEYDALTDEEKNNGTEYFISDISSQAGEDISGCITNYSAVAERADIVSGENEATFKGKIAKWLTDIKAKLFTDLLTSYDQVMANETSGYLVDALAIKEGFEAINSTSGTMEWTEITNQCAFLNESINGKVYDNGSAYYVLISTNYLNKTSYIDALRFPQSAKIQMTTAFNVIGSSGLDIVGTGNIIIAVLSDTLRIITSAAGYSAVSTFIIHS